MSDKVKIVLGLAAIFALMVFALILMNWKGFEQLLTELHVGGVEFVAKAWIGVQILFGLLVLFGTACAVIYLRDRARVQVIGPGKRGAVQALVLADGRVEHLGGMAQMDPAAQLALLEKFMRAARSTAAMQKQLGEQTDENGVVDADAMKRLGSGTPKLPAMVRYEDIAQQIPEDHTLVGINETGVVTRERKVKALTWIVGGSGTGKTNSACIRIEEDYNWGHYFLIIDPHWFKSDSLWNAIKGYQDRFIVPLAEAERPFAYETEDIIVWLDTFLNEFKRRKSGGAWSFPITIVIDEVGSLTTDKTDDPKEIEMRDKIKTVTRICGQESRDFDMGCIALSQDAAGLAWLRKRAIMVIVHQLLMMSERLIACNELVDFARAMDTWPIGRTLIYGLGFREGPRIYQQPMKKPRVVEANPPDFYSSQTQNLPERTTKTVSGSGNTGNGVETASERKTDEMVSLYSLAEAAEEPSTKPETVNVSPEILDTIRRMKKAKMVDRDIAPLVGLGGRKYGLYQAVVKQLDEA